MKTKLFLFVALLISTITFSQTSKKGYNYYKAKSDIAKKQKMNKGELIDAMAKDANLKKRQGRSKTIGNYATISSKKQLRKRPGRTKFGTKISTEGQTHRGQGDPIPGIGITKEKGNSKYLRKRPGRTKYKKSSSNLNSITTKSTKATDYNSSRSNKKG
jgi:hypothetical protein